MITQCFLSDPGSGCERFCARSGRLFAPLLRFGFRLGQSHFLHQLRRTSADPRGIRKHQHLSQSKSSQVSAVASSIVAVAITLKVMQEIKLH